MASDLHRYLYAACFAEVHGRSPRLGDFPATLMPAHANAVEAASSTTGMFGDRFRVQLRELASDNHHISYSQGRALLHSL